MSDTSRYEPTAQDLENIRAWLVKVPYLPHDIDDYFLTVFYRACKGMMERVKERLDLYYGARVMYPEITPTIFPLSARTIRCLDQIMMVPLPKRTEDDCLVIQGVLVDPDPKKFEFVEFLKILTWLGLVQLKDKSCGSCKVIFTLDLKGACTGHMMTVSPRLACALVHIVTRAIPCRLQAVHIFNLPPGTERVLSLVKSFLKDKQASRIHVHSNAEDLLKFLPKKVLPVDYGGYEEPLAKLYDQFKARLFKYAPELTEEEEKLQKLDKIRAQTKDKDILTGSFRQLEID